ncbi:MAG: ferric iron uptake transcriptional regulator [Gammaproteobacteria bacterium]|jgi:Fur family ferric uptake transcriptional regulator|tara:strand:- start:5286 stop:5699 length:414 start_codon:yes stop_codon:yes gene_type:complete
MNKQNTELKKAGLKATLPRIKIMEILESTAIQEEAHFSAEDIYKELLQNGENIGLASVYRVLTQFETAGMVKKHHFEGSHAVYEVVEEHHEHMVDLDTGKVLEFQDAELMSKLNEIAEKSGYQLVDHNLVLHVKRNK